MLTRRDFLRLFPSGGLVVAARAADVPDFVRIDTHVHIHRDAPALLAAIKAANWRGLDIVVCPASGDEPFDLEEKLRATLKVQRDSGGTLAWASTFDARGFEGPDFADRTIARLRQSFEDGAIGVKIWKNIGMAIKAKSGAYLLPDRPRPAADLRGDPSGPTGRSSPTSPSRTGRGCRWMPGTRSSATTRTTPSGTCSARPVRRSRTTSSTRATGCSPATRSCAWSVAISGSDEDDLKRLAKRLDAYPNFAVDTAARVRYFARGDRDQVRQFLTRYQDRILYATDFSLREGDPAAAARSLQATHDRDWAFFAGDDRMDYAGRPTRGLALPDGVLRKIFRENALRWLPGFR